MRGFKKLLAIVLMCTMVLVVVGCSSKDKVEPTDNDIKPTATATPKEDTGDKQAEATPTEEPKPEYDFGGRVLKVGSYYDMTPDPESSAFAEAFAERIAFVESEYNCTIEFVELGGSYVDQYITSVLSGNPVCDVGYILSYRLLPALIEGGIAYPVSDLGVIDYTETKWSKPSVEAGTYKGKTYSMGLAGAGVQYGIFWNKTLFERYGLPNLYDLYDNGEWTWEKFFEIAKAGNQDTDGDGAIDIWGFNQRENLVWSFMASNGANAVKKTDAGVELDLGTPEAMEALTWYADFMQNVPHLQGWLGDWQSQIWSFRDGQSMMCYEAWWISYGYLGDMADEWGFVPFPLGPSGKEYVSYGKETSPWMMLNGIEDPKGAAQIVNLIFDVFETEEEWIESFEATFEAQANDAKAVEICMDLMNKVQISPLMGFSDLNDKINSMLNEIGSGASTPQTALEAHQSELDAAIADINTHDYNADMQQYLITPTPEAEEAAE